MATGRALSIDDRIHVPESVFELDGYRAWVKSDVCPEGVRTTCVGGEVLIDMSPEALERHNKVKTAVTLGIALFVQDRDLGEVYSDRTLVTHEAAGLSVEPDLTFVSWSSFEQQLVRRVEKAGAPLDYLELVGSPDVVVEIVSDASVRKDKTLLRDAHARSGAREYWLIDARGSDLELEILRNEHRTFRDPTHRVGPQESQVLEGRWTLTRSTNRLGHFAYRLTHAAE
ncbi:MAG TPA: Uma2 family endonuclease [Vicinamibacterales bacterium]